MGSEVTELDLAEAVRLGAAEPEIYNRVFFPRTYRQKSPPFQPRMWSALENPEYNYVNFRIFRGGGKTTTLRSFTSRRIAYGISRTIAYIGASEDAAVRSVNWVRGQVEKNKLWASTFQLSPGRTWTERECQIVSPYWPEPIWVVARGIMGNIRGINFDDYRPDTIILDDVLTDESAATKEQRQKVSNLILGAIKNSLISTVEEPNAKLVMLQTPLDDDDASSRAARDPMWHTEVFSCWTPETQDLAVQDQVSAWPEMFPTEQLRADKAYAINQNAYSIFAREMECRLVDAEENAFRADWLQEYEGEAPGGPRIVVVDPLPPPSERELARSMDLKDYEVVMVLARSGGKYYVVDYEMRQGHTPEWTVAKVLEMAQRHRAARIVVEAVAYQRVLLWLLQREMALKRTFFAVKPFNPKGQKKYNRIVQTLVGPASNGVVFVRPSHTELKAQFARYPKVKHDDVLDALSIGLADLSSPYFELGDGEPVDIDEAEYEDLTPIRRAP